jgi:hypothetical protein
MKPLVAEIVEEVKQNGIAFSHVQDLFSEKTLGYYNNVVEYFNEFLRAPHILERCQRIASGNPIQDRGKWFEITQYEYLGRALGLSDSNVINMYLSPEIVEIAEAFHNTVPRLRNVLTWVHPQNAIQQEIASQRWHRDQEDWEIFKVFIAISDIGPNNGPTQYAKKTQHGGPYGDITNNMNGKSTSDLKYPIPPEEIVSCEGKPGTIIFMNTNGLHKGGLVKEGIRCLTQANFLKPDAHIIKIGKLPSFDYSDKINSVDKNLNEYKVLTDKQKLIIS